VKKIALFNPMIVVAAYLVPLVANAFISNVSQSTTLTFSLRIFLAIMFLVAVIGWPTAILFHLTNYKKDFALKKLLGVAALIYFLFGLLIWVISFARSPNVVYAPEGNGEASFYDVSVIIALFVFWWITANCISISRLSERSNFVSTFLTFLGIFYMAIGVFFIHRQLIKIEKTSSTIFTAPKL